MASSVFEHFIKRKLRYLYKIIKLKQAIAFKYYHT